MRTTLDIDDDLLERARAIRPGGTKTELIEEGLRALVQLEERRRLVALFGTEDTLVDPPRRRRG